MATYRYDIPKLLDYLEDGGETDEFLTDMFMLKNLTDSRFEIADAIFNPLISAEDKTKSLEAIFEPDERRSFFHFFSRLVTNGDVGIYWKLRKRIITALEEKKGFVFANVVSAIPLTDAEMTEIRRNLRRMTGRTVYAYNSISGRIIGGFIVKIGGKMIDLSVAGNFLKIKSELFKRD